MDEISKHKKHCDLTELFELVMKSQHIICKNYMEYIEYIFYTLHISSDRGKYEIQRKDRNTFQRM